MELMPATRADLPLLCRWRNDPATRKASRRTHEFSTEDVERWIFDEGRAFFLGRLETVPVGLLSFEPVPGERACEVSILVAPEHRGRGIGRRLLGLAHLYGRDAELRAQVRNDNQSSLRLFRVCGFSPIREDATFTYFVKRRAPASGG